MIDRQKINKGRDNKYLYFLYTLMSNIYVNYNYKKYSITKPTFLQEYQISRQILIFLYYPFLYRNNILLSTTGSIKPYMKAQCLRLELYNKVRYKMYIYSKKVLLNAWIFRIKTMDENFQQSTL